MNLGEFVDRRSQQITKRKILGGKNDFRLPYELLLSREGFEKVHDLVTRKMGEEGIKGFIYTIRSYGSTQEPFRVHVSHRGDAPTFVPGLLPHPEYGAPLKKKPDSPNYVYKIFSPALIAEQYDPAEPTHVRELHGE